MGQKVSTQVIDKSYQEDCKWFLYVFLLKLLGKDHSFYTKEPSLVKSPLT